MKQNLLLALFGFLLIACSTEDDTEGSTENLKLQREIYNADIPQATNDTIDYTYSENGLLIRRAFNVNSGGSFQTFSYSGNRLDQVSYSNGSEAVFTYQGNNISVLNRPNDSFEYDYNSQGQLEERREFQNGAFTCNITYNYSNDNPVAQNDNCLNESTNFEYDNEQNPLNIVYTDAYRRAFAIPRNNVKKQTGSFVETEFFFQYNTSGYPVRCEGFRNGELVTTIDYVYNIID